MTTVLELKPARIPILYEEEPVHKFRTLKKDGMDYYNQFCRGCGNSVIAKKAKILVANLVEIGIKPDYIYSDDTWHPQIVLLFADGSECSVGNRPYYPFQVLYGADILIDHHPAYLANNRGSRSLAFDEVFDACDMAGLDAELND